MPPAVEVGVHFASPIASFDPQVVLHAVPLAQVRWPAQVPDAPATQEFEPLQVLAATVTFGAVQVAPGQSVPLLHCTQVEPPDLQTGVAARPLQSPVMVHPQTSPVTQAVPFALAAHCAEPAPSGKQVTHALVPVSQTFPPVQFALVMHATQVSVVVSHPCVPVQPAAGTPVLLTQVSHLPFNVPPF